MENKLNEQRSLELITKMIADTSSHIEQDSSKYFLLWGYTTVFVSLFEYTAQVLGLNPNICLWAWYLIPIIGGIGTFVINHRSTPHPKSYLDRSINAVWLVFGLSFIMALITALVYKTNILYLTAMLMGMGTVITGIICRHSVLTWTGTVGIAMSLLFPARTLYFRYIGADAIRELGAAIIYSEIIIFAIIFTIMMIIPGHILNHRTKSRNNA